MDFSPSTQAYNRSPVLINPGRSLARSLGYMPSVTHLAKLENGQSGGLRREPAFHRIEMDVIHVSGVILVVADRVLPIPALPDAGLTLADQGGTPLFRPRDGS